MYPNFGDNLRTSLKRYIIYSMTEIKQSLGPEYAYLGDWFVNLDKFDRNSIKGLEDRHMFDQLVEVTKK
jgi:hypothetical protein